MGKHYITDFTMVDGLMDISNAMIVSLVDGSEVQGRSGFYTITNGGYRSRKKLLVSVDTIGCYEGDECIQEITEGTKSSLEGMYQKPYRIFGDTGNDEEGRNSRPIPEMCHDLFPELGITRRSR